ncbi:flagellar motor switch protein FliM [Pseudoneobacillus rhizosphaerae]|uniref:Flagellar motor switch protein FliM n=1 Tax=Pseudoneobacillus rhizosphaerae TaxID=2880968 RepID=A0A9C7LBS8_9BACI|nr:flagellar motor switch protein FliM [Pseudoneobacillus rhizosphaerae]CAG9609752.1 Flagellar motor switch protein FliM [Pseudoneobacillus rhizosphaerae]
MADVLSQQEIDALLSALNSGEIQASDIADSKDKVKVYDFRRAMRYSKEQLRSITRIHENFTRLLISHLSTQLRQFVQIEVDLVDQVTYHEFVASIPSRTIINVFDVSPMDGRMAMEINPQVAYAMVDRLLGGQGDALNRNGSLTEIETVLIKKIFSRAFDMYPDAWENIEEIVAKWEGIESNPQFLQIASPNDTVIIIVLKTTIGETTGRMTLCLPHLTLEPLLPKLSTQQWLYSMAKSDAPQQEKLKQNLDSVDVNVIAELGKATLSVSDLLNLQIGDVIGMEMGKLQVKVGHLPKYLGNPGLSKGRYAVQIDQVIHLEGDDL